MLCDGKSLFLAKCSVTTLSDYRMDFLYLGALGSIQGAREIGFHSSLGRAGRFLFWFFLREECTLLAYPLVGSTPEQETHSVPRIPAAEQNVRGDWCSSVYVRVRSRVWGKRNLDIGI